MKKNTLLLIASFLLLNYTSKAQTTNYGTDSGTGGFYGTYIGYEAGKNNKFGGFRNSYLGYQAGLSNTEGDNNSFFGHAAGQNSTIGSRNSFFGESAGQKNTTGSENSFFGQFVGYENTSGSRNCFFGQYAGVLNKTGSGNLFLGHKAGYNETGSNKLYISNSDTSTPLVYGEFDRKQIRLNGQVGIGTNAADLGSYQLAVEGTVGARKVVVSPDSWADFVFESKYILRDLSEVETFINENKHLPDVPSQKEVAENGVSLGEMDAILLQKIEELTLYIIELDKENSELKQLINQLTDK